MTEKKFSEKESLELISQMIESSKEHWELGGAKAMLIYGYSTVFLSLLVYLLLYFTHEPLCWVLWVLMFVPDLVMRLTKKHREPKVKTHVDKMIRQMWQVLGSLFGLTFVTIGLLSFVVGQADMLLMLPLSLLYAGIGISIMGIALREPVMVVLPFVGFVVSIYMLMVMVSPTQPSIEWNLYFGFSFLLMMVIPAHLLYRKRDKVCFKN
ncbi:MAG: hypothetical protein SPI72_03835 [Porphyromonas sp.]|nr:hypothetical protein [Porphyromonas sp.]